LINKFLFLFQALQEALQSPSVSLKLADTKAAKEVKILESFYKTLDADPSRAFYGYKHVYQVLQLYLWLKCSESNLSFSIKANKELAVESLLICDALFRSRNLKIRKKYVKLVEAVKKNGGDVFLFSSMHFTGNR
jgi:protein pelota